VNARPVSVWIVRERGAAPVHGRVFSIPNCADDAANERTIKTNDGTGCARGRKSIGGRVRELIPERVGESLGCGGEHGSVDGRTSF
jgi:hypothetical protein